MNPTKGRVLISEPFLPDPNFRRTVILITEHTEDGTVGFVLNQKTEFKVNHLIEELLNVNTMVYQGGPVELESFHYLHRYPEITGSTPITDEIYWSGDFSEVQQGITQGKFNEDDFMFFVGYSGWSAGQLEQEIEDKTWIVNQLEDKYLINPLIEDKELWKHAVRNIGGDDSLLANSPKDPYLN